MSERNLRKTRVGKVVSDKMDKTIVVFIAEASDGSRCPACERIFKLCRRLPRLQIRFLDKFRSEKNSCSGKQRTVAGV